MSINSQQLKTFKGNVALALAFIVGAFLGWFLKGDQLSNSSNSKPELKEVSNASRQDLNRSPKKTESSKRSFQRQRAEALLLENELPSKEGHLQIDVEDLISLLNEEFKSLEERDDLISKDEALVRVLELNESEIYELNSLWSEQKSQVEKARKDKTRFKELPDGKLWVGVEPFSQDGQKIRQNLLEGVFTLLGNERAELLLDSVKAGEAFGDWGKIVDASFTISIIEQSNGQGLYEIIEQASSKAPKGRKWLVPRIPKHLEKIALDIGLSLVPELD